MRLMTLIPAFKAQYLPGLVAALERQTRPADAILLSDDSAGDDFLRLLRSDAWAARCERLNLTVVAGPKAGALRNVRSLVDRWAGRSELVHLMLDDDLVYPDFYEKHLALHAAGRFDCTVSLRWIADDQAQPLGRGEVPPQVLAHAQRRLTLDAGTAFATSVARATNWLGEFSNAVVHAQMMPFIVCPNLAGVPVIGLEDLACFLAASLQRPLGLINEHLGVFRRSAQQNSAQVQGLMMKLSTCAWLPLALAGQRLGHLTPEQVMHVARTMGGLARARYAGDPQLAPLCAAYAAYAEGDRAAEPLLLQRWTDYVALHVPHVLPAA